MTIQKILCQRAETHGKFHENSKLSQAIKREIRNSPKWGVLTASQKEALDMIAHKIGRILSGNPDHVDHWADIAGYATLVQNALEKEQST